MGFSPRFETPPPFPLVLSHSFPLFRASLSYRRAPRSVSELSPPIIASSFSHHRDHLQETATIYYLACFSLSRSLEKQFLIS